MGVGMHGGSILSHEFIVEIVDVRHQKTETGWLVALVRSVPNPESDVGIQFPGTIPLVGVWRSPMIGIPHRVEGEIVNDDRWGRQLIMERGCVPVRLEHLISLDGVSRYLSCVKAGIDAQRKSQGLKHLGVGPAKIRELVSAYGKEAPSILRTDPDRVVEELRGWSDEQASVFSEHLQARVDEEKTRIELASIGAGALSQAMVDELYGNFGTKAPGVLRSDPYRFVHDGEDERYSLRGYGWSRADHIARANLGWHSTDPRRLMAAITEALKKNSENGDSWMRRKECVYNAALISGELPRYHAELVGLAPITITPDDRLYLSSIFQAERKVAEYVLDRCSSAPARADENEEDHVITDGLNVLQRAAYQQAMIGGLSILTGGPGRGKTHTIRAILDGLDVRGRNAMLVAPTGRAAARAQEVTGAQTSTIHRMIFGEQVSATDYIVDEMSMVDVMLFARLIDFIMASNPRANLLLVGDADQLPPVKPGRPFVDLILSGIVPVVRLEEVMRTDRGGIVEAAEAANELGPGDIIDAFDGIGCDSFEYYDASGVEAKSIVLKRVEELMRSGVSVDDIQVITATNGYRGATARVNSARDLNSELGKIMNPDAVRLEANASGEPVAVGDRVMQLKNDRHVTNRTTRKEMFIANGEIGVVRHGHGVPNDRLVVDFGANGLGAPRLAEVPAKRNDLRLSWAATCHKFQGSEAAHIIVVFDRSAGRIVDRSWLYTAITRARQSVMLVAPRKAVERACKSQARVMQRRSGLVDLLVGGAVRAASGVSSVLERKEVS